MRGALHLLHRITLSPGHDWVVGGRTRGMVLIRLGIREVEVEVGRTGSREQAILLTA